VAESTKVGQKLAGSTNFAYRILSASHAALAFDCAAFALTDSLI
jgi:hypothetical protein